MNRVDWPGSDSDIGNRIRQEVAKDVVLVRLMYCCYCVSHFITRLPCLTMKFARKLWYIYSHHTAAFVACFFDSLIR
jgi:hypothetical protein